MGSSGASLFTNPNKASPVGLLTGKGFYPGKEGGLSPIQGVGAGLTFGALGYVASKHNEAKAAAQEANAAATAEQNQENQITSESTLLDDLYGVGTDAAAQKSAKDIADQENQYTSTQETASNNVLDAQYQDAQVGNEQSLAAAGNAGGSAQSDLARQNLEQYIAGRQQAVVQAQNQTTGLQNQLNQQRQSQLQQIQSGTVANPSFTATQQDLQSQITDANANVVPQAIGSSLTTIGKVAGSALGTPASTTATTGSVSPAAAAAQSGASLPQSGPSQTGTITV